FSRDWSSDVCSSDLELCRRPAWQRTSHRAITRSNCMSGKPAARVNDPTACPLPGHGNSPITAGSPDVLIENMAAARQGDPTACGATLAGALSATVLINGKPAAVQGSTGSHGNTVTAGAGTVLIG